MKRQLFAALAALALAMGAACGQDAHLEVKGPGVKQIQVDKVIVVKEDRLQITEFPFLIRAPALPDELVFWSVDGFAQYLDKGSELEVTNAIEGKLTVAVRMVGPKLDKDGRFIGFKTRTAQVTVHVGKVPPGPDPGPKPPVPPDPPKPPPPQPAPIDADGLHVLILFESADKAKMSRGHFDVIYGQDMRQWLKANCAADPQAGDGKAYWIVDKDDDLKQLDRKWQAAIQRPRQSVPWIIISNRPKGGHEGPLPADAAETIKLLEKYK